MQMPNRKTLRLEIPDEFVLQAADEFALERETKTRENFITSFPLYVEFTVDVNDYGEVSVVKVDWS